MVRKSRKQKKRSRRRAFLVVLFFLVITPVLLFVISPKTFDGITKEIENFVENPHFDFEPTASNLKAVPEPIIPMKPEGVLEKNVLISHQFAAKRYGVAALNNESQLEDLIAHNKLLVVEDGVGYTLEDMTHSYPYLTPNAKRALERIGLSFYEYSNNNSTITVTSLTRTEDTQKNLRKSNRNATKSESTHTRGVSFDISYIRYNGVKAWNDKHTKVLEGILAAMQADGEIYVIKERKQSCFHITVRN